MKRFSLIALATLALSSVAQAQFTYTAGDGTVLSSTQKPTGVLYWQEGDKLKTTADGKPMRQAEHYVRLESDHLCVDVVFFNDTDGKVASVARYFLYLEDLAKDNSFSLEKNTYTGAPELESFTVELAPVAKSILMLDYNQERLESVTMPGLNMVFSRATEAQKLVQAVRDRAAELKAQPDRAPSTRPRWATFTREFTAPLPAPTAPKRPAAIIVTLVNTSKYEVKITVLDSPKATSSSDYYLAPGQTKLIVTKPGGQVRTRDGYTLLTVTEQMHNTRQVIAK